MEHILLLIYKVMDTLNFLPGEPLHEQYRGRYARLKRTAGDLLSYPLDDLACLLRPVRNLLVLGNVLPNSWREIEGFDLNGTIVAPKLVVEVIGTARGDFIPGSSRLALEVSDRSGVAGNLSFSRGMDGTRVYRTGELLLYPHYGTPVIRTIAEWEQMDKPNCTSVLAQEGVTGFDRDLFRELHTSMHAILPNIIDIPLQHLVLAGDWGY